MHIRLLFAEPVFYCVLTVFIILSICFHEFCHAIVATWCGDMTPAEAGGLTMNPLKVMGVSSIIIVCLLGIGFGRVPIQPANYRHRWQIALVSLAGPVANFIIFGICLGLFKVLAIPQGSPLFIIIVNGAFLNLILGILNILPVPGLDGWSILVNLVPGLSKLISHDLQGAAALLFFALIMIPQLNQFIFDTLFEIIFRLFQSP